MHPRQRLVYILPKTLAVLVGLAAAVFISAGRLDYWQGWAFLALNALFLGLTIVALRGEPGLIRERLSPKGVKRWDKAYLCVSGVLFFAMLIAAVLDSGRFHWSGSVAPETYAAAWIAYAAGQCIFLWAKRTNRFFSSVVRIQNDRGQKVCKDGPYMFVRHPGYVGGMIYMVAMPFMLGSPLAAWLAVPQVIALVVRTHFEDRMLKKGLPGYAAYAKKVRWKLLPGVW